MPRKQRNPSASVTFTYVVTAPDSETLDEAVAWLEESLDAIYGNHPFEEEGVSIEAEGEGD